MLNNCCLKITSTFSSKALSGSGGEAKALPSSTARHQTKARRETSARTKTKHFTVCFVIRVQGVIVCSSIRKLRSDSRPILAAEGPRQQIKAVAGRWEGWGGGAGAGADGARKLCVMWSGEETSP